MATISAEEEAILVRVRKAFDRETVVKETAEVEAKRLVAERVAESVAQTDLEIREALRNNVRVSHIHKFGLGTKNNRRVYDVKEAMLNRVEQVTDVVMVEDTTMEVPPTWDVRRVFWFECSAGRVGMFAPESAEDVFVPVDKDHQWVFDGGKGLFVEAIKTWFDLREVTNV